MANTEVNNLDFEVLLEIFSSQSYAAGRCREGTDQHNISKKCESLLRLDYSLIELDNSNGASSSRYPAKILVPEFEHAHSAPTKNEESSGTSTDTTTSLSDDALNGNEDMNGSKASTTATPIHLNGDGTVYWPALLSDACKNMPPPNIPGVRIPGDPVIQRPHQPPPQPQQQFQCQQNTIYEELYDFPKIREHIGLAKYARCRQRFVVPVILYHGKYICRSATISVMPETITRKLVEIAYDFAFGFLRGKSSGSGQPPNNDQDSDEALAKQIISPTAPPKFSYETVINSDVQLLKALNVTTIVDLMVEKCKIKYLMTVSSSEKADPDNNYADFNILSMPYPGCEFFINFRRNSYTGQKLVYDWSKSINDAPINIPKIGPTADLNINWSNYEKWDLILITQNYLKAILKYVQEENAGLLIHCISGWDRTPLFVSLVRLSLWADGLIHQSLCPMQMTYFALAYDWYLFGHQLPDRLKRGEDIISFCFYMLKYIAGDEFSLVEQKKRTAKTSTCSSDQSSIIVLKSDQDEDQLKEDFILNFEQDSNDSFSNISNCDMPITDNFFQTTTPTMTTAKAKATTTTTTPQPPMNTAAAVFAGFAFNSRSPNPKRSRTSPISVPGSRQPRQRYESTSSTGSWQVVTDTGSLENMHGSYMQHCAANRTSPEKADKDNGISSLGDDCGDDDGLPCIEDIDIDGGSATNQDDVDATSPNRHSNGDTRERTSMSPPEVTERDYRLNTVRAIFGKTYSKAIGLEYIEGESFFRTEFMN